MDRFILSRRYFKRGMYTIESHTFTEPIFTNVHTTYILTLASQPARKAAMLERLRRTPLTSAVHFIINPGAKAKGLGMNASDDLLHVSKFACRMALVDGRPAIFLEDDCEFTSGMTASWAKLAEERILTVDAISFGAFMTVSFRVNRDWIRVLKGDVMHGMLLSTGGMQTLLKLPFTGGPHDGLFYERARLDAPHWPVAVQRHYRTKNSFLYDPSGIKTFLTTTLLKSDSDPLIIFGCAHITGLVGGVYVIIAFLVAGFVSIYTSFKTAASNDSIGGTTERDEIKNRTSYQPR